MKAQFCKKAESDDSDHITLNITICAANELIINDLNHTFPSKDKCKRNCHKGPIREE